MEGEVLAHLELHPVDLGEKPGCRKVVVRGSGLRLAKMGYLSLEMADSLDRGAASSWSFSIIMPPPA